MLLTLFMLAALTGVGGPGVNSPAQGQPTLEDLAWLVGSWNGEGLGGKIEEHWTHALGGTMLGAFRLVVEDKVRVIEYLMITQEEDRVAMRFKHFREDYTTWEEDRALEFTLISLSEREAVFHSEVAEQNNPRRITYRLTGEGDLLALVASSDEEGQLTDSFEIRLTRR